MMKKNESGFTLIEIVVAMVVLSLLMISVVLLMSSWIGRFNTKNLESKILIETQTVNTSLRDSLKAATYYHDYGDVVEIQLTKCTRDVWYYYIVDDEKAYLVSFNDKQDNVASIPHDNGDFLANYISSIDIAPNEFNTVDENNSYLVDYHISAIHGSVSHQTDSSVLIRNGH